MPDTLTAPAPAAAPSASPTPAPAPATVSPFSKVDTQVRTATTPKPEPEKATPKPGEVPKDTARDDKGKFVKPDAKPDAAKPEPKEPKELRTEYDRLKGEHKTLSETKLALERKITDFEARGQDATKLTAKLAELEKERDDLRGQLQASRFEASPQFKQTHEEPFNQAVEVVKQEIPGWQIVETNKETGEQHVVRAATFGDFKSIYAMARPEARKMAAQWFGEDSTNVMSAYDQLHRLENTMNIALDGERKNWEKSHKEAETKHATDREQFRTLADRIEKDLLDGNSEWYGERPGDKEHNDLRMEGYAIVNSRPQTPQEAAVWWADIKHRAANFAPLQRAYALLKAENEALKAKKNGELESEPGAGRRPSETPAGAPDKDWRHELRENVPTA